MKPDDFLAAVHDWSDKQLMEVWRMMKAEWDWRQKRRNEVAAAALNPHVGMLVKSMPNSKLPLGVYRVVQVRRKYVHVERMCQDASGAWIYEENSGGRWRTVAANLERLDDSNGMEPQLGGKRE